MATNLARIQRALEAAAGSVDLAIFPECALTGFHRGIRDQAQPGPLREAAAALQAAVDRLGLAAVVGAPWPSGGAPGAPLWNAALVLRPGQPLRVAPKVGLTPSEARFFAPGPRARPWSWRGWRCATLLCREIDDAAALVDAYGGDVDLLIWPGYIRWRDAGAPDGEGADWLAAAGALAAEVAAPLVQCNWPGSLNAPETRGMGGSAWFDAGGALRGRAPLDAPGATRWRLEPG